MTNTLPFIAIILCLVIALLFYLKVKNFKMVNKWDVLTNYISTILSVVTGAMISMIIYNYQETKNDEQRLNELKTSLEAELSDIHRVLSSGNELTINSLTFNTAFLEPVIIIECAKSGLFNARDIENLLHLSRKIKVHNVQVKFLFDILRNENSPSFSVLLQNCHGNMEITSNQILKDVKQVLYHHQLTLSNSHSK